MLLLALIQGMDADALQSLVEEATFDYTMGDNTLALEKLNRAIDADVQCFDAWLAIAEIHYSTAAYDAALAAAEKAHALDPDDIHINTTLSRIWVELGDKDKAEHYGAQVRLQSWKEELKEPPGSQDSGLSL